MTTANKIETLSEAGFNTTMYFDAKSGIWYVKLASTTVPNSTLKFQGIALDAVLEDSISYLRLSTLSTLARVI